MEQKPKIDSGEQFSKLILISYYRTISMIMRTQNFNIERIKQQIPSSIINRNNFFSSPERNYPKNHQGEINNDSGSTTIVNRCQQKNDEQITRQIDLIKFIDGFDEIALIGNIVKMEEINLIPMYKSKDVDDDQYVCIKAYFKVTYEKDRLLPILISKIDYKKCFVKNFNRMLKNKGQKYAFTNLKIGYYGKDSEQIFFILQPTSYLLQVTDQFYQKKIKAIEQMRFFKFSNLPLTKIYSIQELQKISGDGLALNQIRNRFEQKQKQNLSICGLIEIIQQDYEKKSKKTKQLVLWVYQVVLSKKISQLGRCKIILRYQPTEQAQINSLIKNYHIYLFSNPEMIITDNGNIIYILNNIRSNDCVIKLSEQSVNLDLDSLFSLGNIPHSTSNELLLKKFGQKNMRSEAVTIQNWVTEQFQIVPIVTLFQKSLNRNFIKLQVTLLQTEIIYATIKCSVCNFDIRSENGCSKLCENSESLLKLWGTIRGVDSTAACLISLEHTALIQFLELHEELAEIDKITRNYVKQQKSGLVLLTSNKDKKKQFDDPLFSMKQRIRRKWVEKIVVGNAQMNIDKTFRDGLTQNEQLDFHNSFQSTKKFLQQKKIFPNGSIQKRSEQLHFVPYIKAVRVYSAPPFF